MLKEIVEFSKQLKEAGVYKILDNDSREIPQIIKINLHRNENNSINKHCIKISLDEQSERDIFSLYRVYTRPFAKENNKTLGGSKGLDTASFFSFRYQWTVPTNEKYKQFRDDVAAFKSDLDEKVDSFSNSLPDGIEKSEKEEKVNNHRKQLQNNFVKDGEMKFKKILLDKWKNTFKKDNLNKDLFVEYDNALITNLIDYFEKNAEEILEDILSQGYFGTPFIVFFWIDGFTFEEMELLLKYDQKKYIEKGKAFKDSKRTYGNQTCSICGQKQTTVGWPSLFNVNTGKPFSIHNNRHQLENIICCSKCSEELTVFRNVFLSKITLFPLFVNKALRAEAIDFLKSGSENHQKNSFKAIIHQIYKKTSLDNLDYYLIQYDGNSGFISFDYITGFRFYNNGISVFQLEMIMDRYFFDYKLTKYYFGEIKPSSKLASEEKIKINNIGGVLYRFRNNIFDYVYRAKYNSLNKKDILEIYIKSLRIKLRDFFYQEKTGIVGFIIKMNESYFKLNKYFGGDFMDTVERIKQEKKIKDDPSFAFFTGQIVNVMLRQSKSENKTHAMVEPFINVKNLKVLYKRVEDLFNAYKHSKYLYGKKFNYAFSSFWQYLLDNLDKDFTEEMKIAFYAGYFDNNSLVYDSNDENKEDKDD